MQVVEYDEAISISGAIGNPFPTGIFQASFRQDERGSLSNCAHWV
jgi:hypothetical protein